MSGWYLCADLTSAVDAYDVLGVEPGPADAQHTPLQRIMALSQVRGGSSAQELARSRVASTPDEDPPIPPPDGPPPPDCDEADPAPNEVRF
eukprot:symbB.v1.2.028135.t1/scaffold2948.1/size94957/7